ncbi:hypothetical protein PNBC_12745 [Paenibacillus crassostreae]|uniref:Protein kinase domain-containing protein n=2 Tax=Paenibacillus crassostreae TaxID=1763538 RepID=A0A167DX90_9BACL|nr:hypothetical protein PNBC_12745 [Paenibacillus crassostreae]
MITPSDNTSLYEDLYDGIFNENLKYVFTRLHTELNDLLQYMNARNTPGVGGHYNAVPSRKLSELIDIYRQLRAQLSNSSYRFIIDPHYEDILERCRRFLRESNGSPIPEDFPRIDIIEYTPAFILQDVTDVKRSQTVDSFTLKSIGGGSYATVYKFKDKHYNRHFALKKAKKDLTDKELQRFKNEYLELRKLNSPYIVEVNNYNEEKSEYTMEFVDSTLEKYILKNNTKLSMAQRIALISQLFKAFSYIHGTGILHRDISYQNILVKIYDDGSNIIKVSDFGLVKLRESSLTSNGSSIKGTLNDPALNIVGFNNYETRHEVYALAQVVNFILSGRKLGIYDKTESIKKFIIKGLSPDIEVRFSNMKEMSQAFQKLKSELLSIEEESKD